MAKHGGNYGECVVLRVLYVVLRVERWSQILVSAIKLVPSATLRAGSFNNVQGRPALSKAKWGR